ncbi:recombinase RecA [bacterium]|jgi:circadian clock protein KaiC|nr:recombinase RecA [bacterium]MBT3582034.1 recombinase RecA [bacterium]MBT4552312.1 recombinase RecA [bacterium]MBT5989033.1 recombinase RecA [bacterium]MBT7087833.1 recombinase RecA [bacterium]
MAEKILSGIEGMDELLYGGIPKGKAYLVSGEPGTGKTIFSLQYLLAGAKKGEKCAYISIDEKPEHIIADAESLGWGITPFLNNGSFQILDISSYFGKNKFDKVNVLDTNKIVKNIIQFVRTSKATRLAIDPIAPLIFAEKDSLEIIEYIRKLIYSLEDNLNCTSLLTSYVPVGSAKLSSYGIEEFATSGIILLKLSKINNKYIRSLWIRKMRGTRVDLSEYSFEILPRRGIVLRQPI